MSHYLVGIDVGGTFTDFVAYDRDSGTISVWKNLTTPGDPTDGILEGLRRIDDRASHQPCAPRHDGRHQRHPGAQGAPTSPTWRRAASATCPSSSAATARRIMTSPGSSPSRSSSTATATSSTSGSTAMASCSSRSTRPGCAGSCAQLKAVGRDRGDRRLPAVLLHRAEARATRRGDHRRGMAGRAGLHLLRRAAALEGV